MLVTPAYQARRVVLSVIITKEQYLHRDIKMLIVITWEVKLFFYNKRDKGNIPVGYSDFVILELCHVEVYGK
jgi:hypothetical protein